MLEHTATDIRVSRHSDTQEDFTPEYLLEELGNEFFSDDFGCPDKTFLDNSCGNGNILLYVIGKRLDSGMTYMDSLSTVYGIDLMADNIAECHERIKRLLDERCIEYDESEVDAVLQHNIVCYDALEWDYDNWKPKPKYESHSLF